MHIRYLGGGGIFMLYGGHETIQLSAISYLVSMGTMDM